MVLCKERQTSAEAAATGASGTRTADFTEAPHHGDVALTVMSEPIDLERETDEERSARFELSLIHISEPTRLHKVSRMPSSA